MCGVFCFAGVKRDADMEKNEEHKKEVINRTKENGSLLEENE